MNNELYTITKDPSVDNGNTYASGNLVCEKLTLTDVCINQGQALLKSITITDQSAQDAELDLVFFDSDPSNTTFTENNALDIADADNDKVAGTVTVSPGHYIDASDNSVATVRNLDLVLNAKNGQDIYVAVITRGTPTYAAAGDLRLRFDFVR